MKTIGANYQTALLEAYTASASLIPAALRPQFLLVGGTCMIALGSRRQTEDVDIAVSPAALDAFQTAAQLDARFSLGPLHNWTYTCQGPATANICVGLEFLGLEGGFLPAIKDPCALVGGGFRPRIGELVLMKALAADSRGEDRDLHDLRFLLRTMMDDEGESFRGVEMDDHSRLVLKSVVADDLGGGYVQMLRELMNRC
ncbi:MAG: hypothetical protein M1826_002196 [Phylliscum demangeonii]|nr:MAG: hypothetical protein M1826_002196 [Phylliscum demangeonii]